MTFAGCVLLLLKAWLVLAVSLVPIVAVVLSIGYLIDRAGNH